MLHGACVSVQNFHATTYANCNNSYGRHSTSTNVLPSNKRVHQQHEPTIPLPMKKFIERKRRGNKEWPMDDVGVYAF